MKIQSHILHSIGETNTGNARFQAPFQFDLHSFDQNLLSFENSLFSTKRKNLLDVEFFAISLSLFIFSSFYLSESKP